MTSPGPDKVKTVVRARDDYRCVECGITADEHMALTGRDLDVHRIKPGSRYTLEGCVTLCRVCHMMKPKSPYGSGNFNGSSYKLSIDGETYDLLQALADHFERPAAWQLRIAIRDAARSAGLLPPTPPPADEQADD